MKSYNERQWNKRHLINIRVLMRKEPHVSPLNYNADIVLMGKYFPNMTFLTSRSKVLICCD
jgi:hypothetical protein